MNDQLRVAVVAHVRHPVARPYMGGMEAHADLLTRALIRRGHKVTLFASGDSAPDLPVDPIAPCSYEAELPWALHHGQPELRAWLATAYQRAWSGIAGGQFDIVHNNSLFPDIHDWAARDGMPMLTSLHVPPFMLLREAIERSAVPWVRHTVTSASQLALWPTLPPRQLDVAWNGIELNDWPWSSSGNGRGVWIGRITPNKGTIEALNAATAAGIGLDIIGPVECSDYYARVEPFVTGPHRYIGHLSGPALARQVRQASVMIATPMWDEPFGLTVAEAMACGVPVAALDRGAMREVVGDTGSIADNVAALPDAIRQAMTMSRIATRRRVEQFFSADAMIGRYEAAYHAAIQASTPARSSRMANTVELLA